MGSHVTFKMTFGRKSHVILMGVHMFTNLAYFSKISLVPFVKCESLV